jgi:hemerythrin-like domain-containing protein
MLQCTRRESGSADEEQMYTLTELGEVLHEEHFRILVPICGLENRITGRRASEPLDPRNEDDRNLLEDLVPALEHVIQHNVFEETVLFPLLCDHGEVELAELLVQEHVAIGPLARRLSGLASELMAQGTSSARWAEFREVAQELVSEMLLHLQKEELSVVQRLDAFLDAETDHRLANKLATARLVSPRCQPQPTRAERGRAQALG